MTLLHRHLLDLSRPTDCGHVEVMWFVEELSGYCYAAMLIAESWQWPVSRTLSLADVDEDLASCLAQTVLRLKFYVEALFIPHPWLSHGPWDKDPGIARPPTARRPDGVASCGQMSPILIQNFSLTAHTGQPKVVLLESDSL